MKRTLLTAIAVCAVMLCVYFGIAASGTVFDLTAERSATLSRTTLDVLERVGDRTHITAFFPRESPGRVEAATLLSRYRDANRKITFDILDPLVVPGEVERLGVTDVGSAAVEALADDDVEIAQYAIELDLTSAIARLERDVVQTVCFTSGHGERSLEKDGAKGLGDAATVLEGNGYKVTTIDLLASTKIPRCAAIVIPAPKNRIGSRALDALRAYSEASGKLFVLADPDADADLTPVVKRYGLAFGRGVVVEGNDDGHLPDDLTAPIITRYAGGSPVVRGLGPTFFPRTMAVETRVTKDPGLTVTELASTSPVSYLDAGAFNEFDPKTDTQGPIVIGAAADDSRVVDERTDTPVIERTRILAWGDVDFVSNSFITDGSNARLFLQSVDWLTQPEDLVGAVPEFPKVRELELTQARSRYTLFLMAGVIPGLFVIAGLMVWVLRRSR